MRADSISISAALLAGTAQAFNFGQAPEKPQPHLVDGFPFKDVFVTGELESFDSTCEASSKFTAYEFTLNDLMEPSPKGLKPWSGGLKRFFSGREYPGGWSGYDRHLNDRSLLMMEYHTVPTEVREWIEKEARTSGEGDGLFAVLNKPKTDVEEVDNLVQFTDATKDRSQDMNKVTIFAPAAIYYTLPLWVAEGSKCKDDLLNMDKYKPVPADGAVVGWPEHKKPDEDSKKMEFLVRVKALGANKESGSSESASATASKDEL